MTSSDERSTQKTIAQAVGCSVMTVSRVLRGHPNVSGPLRDLILQKVEQLEYRPDAILSSLIAYRTRRRQKQDSDVIIYLTNWKTEFGWQKLVHLAELYNGTKRRALELGFKLEPFWLRSPGLTKRRVSEILHARGIRGIVIAPIQANVGHITLDWKNFSCVSIGHSVLSPRPHFVTSDYFQGLATAWRRLHQMGYKRIGLAIGNRHNVRTLFRWNSAYLGLQERLPRNRQVRSMLEPPPSFARSQDFPEAIEKRSLQKWLLKEKPDAVLSLGPGIPDWISELGFRVPEDIGYADLDLDRNDGQFAGVYQNPEMIGAASIDLLQILLQRFECGLPEAPQSITINASWVEGTTACAREGMRKRESGTARRKKPQVGRRKNSDAASNPV